jgi:nucleotide-binding universal stress UspA family protein
MSEAFPSKILVATDGSEDAALAARIATDLSARAGAELHVAHAWHSVPSTRFEAFIRAQLSQEARELLSEQVEVLESIGGRVAEAHLMEGPAVDEILDLAEEIDADLIVVGSRGFGPVKRIALGSVSEGIIHHSARPVIVARGGDSSWPPGRIVVGDDGSEGADRAAKLAANLGATFGTEVLLVRVYPPFHSRISRERRAHQLEAFHEALSEGKKDLGRRASMLEGALGSPLLTKLIEGDVATAIVKEAERDGRATLVVLGSRGLGPISRIRLGSVSTKVARAAEGTVLICPR